jgi:hypothetical protein
MSVNCRRMNFTFSRSARSRICAFVSRGGGGDAADLAMGDWARLYQPPGVTTTNAEAAEHAETGGEAHNAFVRPAREAGHEPERIAKIQSW